MTKFNVGDSIEFIEKYGSYEVGDKVTLTAYGNNLLISFEGEKGEGCAFESRFKLSEKPTKNQRITALENELSETKNEVAELKLIVHELRDGPKTMRNVMNEVLSEPSTTNTVEDIIEFEGQQYRKVDRQARDGDVVVFDGVKNKDTTNGKPYKVKPELVYIDNSGINLNVYAWESNPDVYVYELIQQKPLTPNQQRAAIIEKAKVFVDENGGDDYHFEVDENERTVFAWKLVRSGQGYKAQHGIATCNPSDVYNEYLGRAISFGRAENLDVSEFEQAVQPTVAIGQLLARIDNKHDQTRWKVDDLNDTGKNLTIIKNEFESLNGETADGGYLPNETWYKIVDDTNTKYEVSSNE